MNDEELKDFEQVVTNNTSVRDAAELLVHGVAKALEGLSHDPVAIAVLAKELHAKAAAWAAAVVANTDKAVATAAPAPPAPPKPAPAPKPPAPPEEEEEDEAHHKRSHHKGASHR